jgi:hypothetical protein
MSYYRQLLIEFAKINRIVFFAIFVVLIVFLAHTISYSNALDGKQPQLQQQQQQQQQNSTIFNVKVTYPPPLQQIPIGNSLTIFGTSKYDTTDDACTVYANSNGLKFQKVIAVGPSGNNNYSSWIFTFAKNYSPIAKGINKLTAKISCKAIPNNLTAYYVSNVTGITQRNNINTFTMNLQNNKGNSMLESTIPAPNNSSTNNNNNYNNGKVSNPPFWFPNLFHNNISNSGDNHNSNTIQSLQESGKLLGISIKVAKNPIVWGNEQTIKISVFDPNANKPISNAIVAGSITFPGLNTAITSDFTIASNNLGTASYSWLIADKNAKAGVYNLEIRVSASGYKITPALTKFRVMPIVVSNENNIQNKTTSNNLDKNTPAISTLHTGLTLSR